MLIKILLVIAIVIQCVATGYALRLVRTTKYNSVWILFIVGFSLLSVERLIQLLLVSGFEVIPRWWFAAQQAYPHGRAPHRGEGPVAFLEGAARRSRAAALFGQNVAYGPRA